MPSPAETQTYLSELEISRGLTLENLFSHNLKQLEAWHAQCEKRFLLYGGAAEGVRWKLLFNPIWFMAMCAPVAAVSADIGTGREATATRTFGFQLCHPVYVYCKPCADQHN